MTCVETNNLLARRARMVQEKHQLAHEADQEAVEESERQRHIALGTACKN